MVMEGYKNAAGSTMYVETDGNRFTTHTTTGTEATEVEYDRTRESVDNTIVFNGYEPM